MGGKDPRTHVFSANLPTGFFLIHPLGDLVALISKPNNDIALDRPQRANPWGARGVRHRADRDVERRASRSMAIVRQFTVVEVSLEDDQVGFREMKEEIWSFGVEVPVGESGTPEGVLFVDLENDPLCEYRERFPVYGGSLTQIPCFSYS